MKAAIAKSRLQQPQVLLRENSVSASDLLPAKACASSAHPNLRYIHQSLKFLGQID